MMLMALIVSFNARSQVVDDTIRTVIISEFHEGVQHAYLELTNVGDDPVNLKDFEIGHITWKWAYQPEDDRAFMFLPDFELKPDSTFVVAHVFDYAKNIGEPITAKEYWEEADVQVHFDEGIKNTDDNGLDSISSADHLFWTAGGGSVYYLRYHVGEDSVVVDGMRHHFFNVTSGSNVPSDQEQKVVAGVPGATGNSVLIRKTSVTQGNQSWTESRGTGPQDSEWIVVPMRQRTSGYGNKYFTTLGHHGEAQIDGSIQSDLINIDIQNKTMEVPWGVYGDSIMDEINVTSKGIAWHYYSSPDSEDSISNLVVTGDSLSIFAVGAEVERIDFALIQSSPADDVAEVFPKNQRHVSETGWVSWYPPYYVTENQPSMDTIGGIPFATRTDSLIKYLEKAPAAEWEFVWVDEVERADLKVGDLLRVTAEDGSTIKDYYLAVDSFPQTSNDAHLIAITWPDIPEYISRNPAWTGDTIPTFAPGKTSYSIELPYGTTQVPSLVAITRDLNAQVSSSRAVGVSGSLEERTTTFTVLAEDDSTELIYSIEFYVERPPSKIQPFQPEPIISQFGSGNFQDFYVEITNPGTKPLDLSNYMICATRDLVNANNPAEVITYGTGSSSWNFARKYSNYIPGYVYKNQTAEEWALDSGIVVSDLRVNPIIGPGESFLIGRVKEYRHAVYETVSQMSLMWVSDWNGDDVKWEANREQWGIEDATLVTDKFWAGIPGWRPHTSEMALFKITNDSIHDGTKAICDPDDFELIDFFGAFSGVWSPGKDSLTKFNPLHNIRKPEIWQPNPGIGTAGSWADTDEESEWNYFYRDRLLLEGYTDNEIGQMLASGWGYHVMDPITMFKSTITSQVYNVSDGFETPQDIDGVVTGTTVTEFMGYINKEDEDQTLELLHRASDAAVEDGDTLKVTSADGLNNTMYILSVTDEGLPSDAVLQAVNGSGYTIEYSGETGTISGIVINSTINDVLENIIKPGTATLNITDADGNLVPRQTRNFNGDYIKTMASNDIYFEVVAGDHITKITYQLKLKLTDDDAFVFSNVYDVDQDAKFISDIPGGTNVEIILKNLFPNEGASIQVVDKNGIVRELGDLKYDDNVIVTSPDETVSKLYRLQFNEEALGNDAYLVSEVFMIDDIQLVVSNVEIGTSVAVFMSLIETAPGATFALLDESGTEKTSGAIEDTDKVEVTSASGSVTVYYLISLLGTEAIVLSDSYIVNQSSLVISEVPNGTDVETFLGNLNPSFGAVLSLLDTDGNAVTSGVVQDGFSLEVVSGDELITNVYTITLISSVAANITSDIQLYPNPVSDILYIDGLEDNHVLVIRNILGMTVKMADRKELKNNSLPVGELPAGVYFISVFADKQMAKQMKFVKE